ncbi:MAG TPA: A/G-specific adenine glycosylase [Puia sp.]|jgi:A/G-specific adenine glycosylase|nr:A/G-specific adenine glycosylase [Puia sp.]
MKSDFTKKLLLWNHTHNKRSMPWKGEKDAYKIWLSEIILQQTRVEQGLNYYNRFIKEFPTVHHLAKASRQKVYKSWEGLGYYTRCKNLIETGNEIVNSYQGKFPCTYDEIKKLKGIGPYTAAAISSFAFNLPYAVVDGNVIRILSRYFGMTTPANSSQGKKLYAEIAQSLLSEKKAGKYNQAIMDFGAVICKPKNPLCTECIQKKDCQAFQHDWVNMLPIKEKKIEKKQRWFYYFIFENKNDVYIRQRKEKDIWGNLFEFILVEKDRATDEDEILKSETFLKYSGKQKISIAEISPHIKQQLTHQTIHVQFLRFKINGINSSLKKDFLQIPKKQLSLYAFPKIIASYLRQNT